jgi:hypothetical protein
MSEFDDRLRSHLDADARRVTVEPDWDDLSGRLAGRDRRRTRLLAAALVVSVLAGPVLGFVAGRGSAPDDADVRAVAGAADGVDVDGGSTTTVPATTVPPGGFAEGPALDRGGPYPYHGGEFGWGGEPMTRLFVRDGGPVRVRAYGAPTTGYDDGIPWWDPPVWCFPSGWVQADVSTELAVAIAGGNTYAELRPGAIATSVSVMGLAEGEPGWVVVAQVPAGAAEVRATFAGGATDEMEPVDGLAVLVGRAPAGMAGDEVWNAAAHVEALDGDGGVVAATDVSGNGVGYYDPGSDPGCVPPPEPLPPPGEEQPADPEAARAAVSAAFATAYNGQLTPEERQAAMEDATGFDEIMRQLREGPFAEQVGDATVQTTDVVFLSASRAAVRYDILIANYTNFTGRLGEAVLVDGQWKVTRETMCRDISMAGVTCP